MPGGNKRVTDTYVCAKFLLPPGIKEYSANIFVFIWKYVKDFTLKYHSHFEICEKYITNIQKK